VATAAAGASSGPRRTSGRRRPAMAVGLVCVAAAVAVLAHAPGAAAAQQHEHKPASAQHGYVRRRPQQQQQEQEQEGQGQRHSGAGLGRIRGLEESGGDGGGDVSFQFLQQYGMPKAPGPLSLTPDRKVRMERIGGKGGTGESGCRWGEGLWVDLQTITRNSDRSNQYK
jgi:hypothetical protein